MMFRIDVFFFDVDIRAERLGRIFRQAASEGRALGAPGHPHGARHLRHQADQHERLHHSPQVQVAHRQEVDEGQL